MTKTVRRNIALVMAMVLLSFVMFGVLRSAAMEAEIQREEGHKALYSIVDMSDYRETEQSQINFIIEVYDKLIDEAENNDQINKYIGDAEDAIKTLKTAAEYEAEEAEAERIEEEKKEVAQFIKKVKKEEKRKKEEERKAREAAEEEERNLTQIEKLLKFAETWVGVPYGNGDSRERIDCTRLMWKIFEEIGIKLPHGYPGEMWNAMKEKKSLTKKDTSGLKAGDLIFFIEKNGKTGHVGMYMGDGKIIHASPKYGVVIQNLWKGEGRYNRTPTGVARVFGKFDD